MMGDGGEARIPIPHTENSITNIYESTRLRYVPVGDVKYEDFFLRLVREPGILNSDTSLPVGFSAARAETLSKALVSRKLLAMYICLPAPGGLGSPIPIGVVALSKPEEGQVQHGNASISIQIAAKHQRKGYGREAIAWVLDWAFDFARLHRVEIASYSWNPGAKRLYSSMGFTEEGVKRETIWFMGGWHDMHELAILEHEWRGKWRDEVNIETWASKGGQAYSSEQIAQRMGSA
ncbi:acyl-CoA N-acyltransferase [Xylaria sp. FL0064]|nr:acyl-CoA N-acyltransferase [Xylaria sp. FL0064]